MASALCIHTKVVVSAIYLRNMSLSMRHPLWRFDPLLTSPFSPHPPHPPQPPPPPPHSDQRFFVSKILLLLIVDVVIVGRQTCVLWQAFTVSRRRCVYNAGFGRTLLTLFSHRSVIVPQCACCVNYLMLGHWYRHILFLTKTDCSWRRWLVVKKWMFVNKRVALLLALLSYDDMSNLLFAWLARSSLNFTFTRLLRTICCHFNNTLNYIEWSPKSLILHEATQNNYGSTVV